ncbi:MAG: SUMF1/EgtB/PvdO family nonheme iron enzyme [Chthoniobacteraceae bacterium]|nr:SUMF1/EgtB/PvdO family nonheme iron enzyme [Chthoniobacteraceae bacterium]
MTSPSLTKHVFSSLATAVCLLASTELRAAWPTNGGEGGREIMVTSLAESGPGTLQEALEAKGPRIIKFAVGGEIWLNGVLKVTSPNVTIAGESAPAPGITLMGDRLRYRTHDVIMRNIRIRVGARLVGTNPDGRDALEMDGGDDGKTPACNILIENCSISWAIDENVQVWGPNNHDIAIRNCIIAEGLRKSLHPKGAHSAGLLVSTGSNVVIQGNLLASNDFRNPVITSNSEALVVNNFIYNPGFAGVHFYGRDGKLAASTLQVDVIGNVVKAGPDTRKELGLFHETGLNAGSRIYFHDNLSLGTEAFNEKQLPKGWAPGTTPFVNTPPVPVPDYVKVLPASQVMETVLANAGARVHDRDAVDARLIEEAKTGKGSIKDAPTDPRLVATPAAPADQAAPAVKVDENYRAPRAAAPAEKGKNITQEIAPGTTLDLVWVDAVGCWVGKYEVTQQQYEGIAGKNPSTYRGATLPVDNVNWNDATAFCKKLTARLREAGLTSSGNATLPTEQQWSVFVGDAKLSDAVYDRWAGKPLGTMPVGSKGANQYGLYDVRGNVNEWCAEKVLRGGGWANTGDMTMDLPYRMRVAPNTGTFNTGFRVVLIP